MTKNSTLKIGLFAIGLEAYWPQFEGLEERLEKYLEKVHNKLSSLDREIVNLGMVDAFNLSADFSCIG